MRPVDEANSNLQKLLEKAQNSTSPVHYPDDLPGRCISRRFAGNISWLLLFAV
jgi:hypothetical protein